MKVIAIFLAVLGTLDIQAQGIIWSVDDRVEIGVRGIPPYDSWEIAFDHVSDPGFLTPPSQNPATMIFSMSLVTNNTGYTFVADAMSEAGFDGFVAGLTDGENDYIRFQAPNTSSWELGSEQLYLGRSSLAPDLAGYNITEIAFRVSSFYDWYEPMEDRHYKTLDYSLDFYGVPEPSTWALLALGAAAFLLRLKAPRSWCGRMKSTSRKLRS